jgi:hypothetical protein
MTIRGAQQRGDAMRTGLRYGLLSALLTMGLGLSSAEAFVAQPSLLGTQIESAATPAAMCGRTCRSGGRYIPGPPSVCDQNGLEYCGPSRDRGPPPAVVVRPVPGVQLVVPQGRRDCRTITTRRPDGSVVTVRRCD